MATLLAPICHSLQKLDTFSTPLSKSSRPQRLSIARTASTPLRRRIDRRPEILHVETNEWSFEQRIQEAINVLEIMEAQGMEPDPNLFCILLKSCADAENLEFGKTIHSKIVGTQLENNVFVVNNLINLYGKCGFLKTARRLFEKMPLRNAVAWTSIISMYSQLGDPDEALELYSMMKSDGKIKPNVFTYTIALNSCAKTRNLQMGIEIHEDIARDGCEGDAFIVTALIEMYSKCGMINGAKQVFDKIAEPTVVACTAMIEGYNTNNRANDAMHLIRKILHSNMGMKVAKELGFTCLIRSCIMEMALRQGQEIHAHMVKSGYKPVVQTISTLVLLYEKCNKMELARHLFDVLLVKNLELWGRMISGYVRNGLYEEALKLYSVMVSESIDLDPFVLAWVLEASTGVSGFKEGMEIHGRAIKGGSKLSKDSLVASLVKMYNEFGCQEEVHKLVKCHRNQS